jgi:ribosomal protein S18 acetylase RimI-like enzyme
MATEYSVRLAPYAIARIKLERVGPDHLFIDWVYVPPGWRDQGLGGQLMRRVLEDADAHGVRLSLEARACGDTDQAALERWYRSLGFVRAGRTGALGPIYIRSAARTRAA